MFSNKYGSNIFSVFKLNIHKAQGQEVEFHEIEIQLFQEVEFSIMRSKFNLFMRSNFFAKLIRR
jgi:hypothetical protein